MTESELDQRHKLAHRFESAHQLMMKVWARCGLIDEAMEQYDQLGELLRDVFKSEPSHESRLLRENILKGMLAEKREELEDQTLQDGVGWQPVLVGREADIATLYQEIASGRRLVTIVGLGGIGKTTIAKNVAARFSNRFTSGARDVYLVQAETPQSAMQLIALSLGIEVLEDVTISQIVSAIGSRHMLLLLDNLEQVLSRSEAAAEMFVTFIETLLRGCDNLHILATSREPLARRLLRNENTIREYVYAVKPLNLSASVELFLRHLAPDIAITKSGISMIAAICEDLDGWPLAIQIVASHLRNESQLPTIRDSILRTRMSVKIKPDAPGRHVSVEAALDWSYEQLSEDQQRLFLGLGVFGPGFDLEDIKSVLQATWLHPNSTDVKGLMDGLVNKGLVEKGELGYQLHPLVSEYARSRVQPEQLSLLKRLHASHFAMVLGIIDQTAPQKERMNQALSHFDRKRTNIDTAWTYLMEACASNAPDPKISNLLCTYALAAEYLGPLRYSSEQRIMQLEAAKTAAERLVTIDADKRMKISVLLAEAYCGNERLDDAGHLDANKELYIRLAELIFKRALPENHDEDMAMQNRIGDAHLLQGRFYLSEKNYGKAIRIGFGLRRGANVLQLDNVGQLAASARDPYALTRAYRSLGYLFAKQGLFDPALACYKNSLELAQLAKHERSIALTRWYMGLLEESRGNSVQAIELMTTLVEYETKLNHPLAAKDEARLREIQERLTKDEM